MSSSKRVSLLKEHVFSENVIKMLTDELRENTGKDDFFTVFISVCNKKERARVFHGSGSTIHAAWSGAERGFREFQKKLVSQKKPFSAVWVKADVVTGYEEIPATGLNKLVVDARFHNFLRKGISFDRGFSRAFIEAEVNGNKMLDYNYSQNDVNTGNIDYDSILINLGNVNHYLKTYYGLPSITQVPDKIIIFGARCFFCGEEDVVYELYENDMDYGRRKTGLVDDKVINEAIVGASEFLVRQIGDDGKFIYGYFPIFGSQIENYNILRHTSTLWSIINLYRISGDDSLIPKLEKAIGYIDDFIDFKDENTAYLVEKGANEVKLGANGVAIIMYTEYMTVFGSDKYVDIVRKLANGILELQDPGTGKYYHVLNFPDYSKKEEFRIVYYDGEATFALARAYSCTKDKKYLDGAAAAVENFIREDYIKHRDHWVAYSLLEVTKYVGDVRYYEFALNNIDRNLKGIYERETSFHTYLEMLMTGWQTYRRALKDGVESELIKEYDPAYFAQTIYHRARHMLNGYFYPEFAMYMKYPDSVVGSFHVRHHNYRVRIDDVQHFIGGYYFYCVYFNEIRPYLTDV